MSNTDADETLPDQRSKPAEPSNSTTHDGREQSDETDDPDELTAAAADDDDSTAVTGDDDDSTDGTGDDDEPADSTADANEEPASTAATASGVSEYDASTRQALATAERVSGLTAVFGTFVFWTPVLFTAVGVAILSNIFAGALAVILAAYNTIRTNGGHAPMLIASVLLVGVGAWIVASPFVLDPETAYVLWANVVLGSLIALLGALTVVLRFRID